MRIEELSVGDWVAIESAQLTIEGSDIAKALVEQASRPVRIVSISGDEKPVLGEIKEVDDWVKIYLKSEFVESIPLTEEILKDNGFYKFSRRYCLRVGHNQISILIGACYTEVEYMNGSLSPDCVEINYSHQYEFPYVIAVHQLQHILRLADFRKEIKL